MEIVIEKPSEGVAVVQLFGRLDLLSAPQVKQRLNQTVTAGQSLLIVDLHNVPFVDSSGLGALVGGLKAARYAGGDLRIIRVGQQARVILELTSLDRVLRIFPTLDTALSGDNEA